MNLVLLVAEDFADAEQHARACAGEPFRVELRGRRARHLREVHRATVGRELRIGLLDAARGRGSVVALDVVGEAVTLEGELREPPPPRVPLTLVLALPRPKTLRRVLQCAATLGLARVALVNAWRVDKSYWKSPKLAPEAIAKELALGLEQGGDTVAPQVTRHRLLRPFVERELPALADGSRRLVAHPAAATPCPRAVDDPLTLALGPEGGFIDRELALFARAGFEPVTLGPRPLRVEQALPALVGRLT